MPVLGHRNAGFRRYLRWNRRAGTFGRCCGRGRPHPAKKMLSPEREGWSERERNVELHSHGSAANRPFTPPEGSVQSVPLQRAVRFKDVHFHRRLLPLGKLELRNLHNAFIGQRHGKNQEGEFRGPDPAARASLFPTLRPRQVELGSTIQTTSVAPEIRLTAMPAQNVKMPCAMPAHLGCSRVRMMTLRTNQFQRRSRAGRGSFWRSCHRN